MSNRNEEDDDDVEWGNVLLLILMVFLLAPINAFVIGTVCSKIWQMLIEQSLGEGPSPAAWFGIATIIQILTYFKLGNDPKTEKKLKQHPIITSITLNVGNWLIIMIALLTAALSARILGWS